MEHFCYYSYFLLPNGCTSIQGHTKFVDKVIIIYDPLPKIKTIFFLASSRSPQWAPASIHSFWFVLV